MQIDLLPAWLHWTLDLLNFVLVFLAAGSLVAGLLSLRLAQRAVAERLDRRSVKMAYNVVLGVLSQSATSAMAAVALWLVRAGYDVASAWWAAFILPLLLISLAGGSVAAFRHIHALTVSTRGNFCVVLWIINCLVLAFLVVVTA